jgi:glycosyltransferase involved in cell wall biosynthesis
LVEKNDSNALAQQILMCINGEVKNLHTIVENAYHTVQNKYSWDIISDLVFKAYQQL